MRPIHLLLSASLLALPFALAHDPAGTPKNYCEEPAWDWQVHDYAPPATGLYRSAPQDGNILFDCNGDGTPADYDGHQEWALGGAMLSVYTGDGLSSGSLVCYGEVGHHPEFGTIGVTDLVFGAAVVPFWVSADHFSVIPPTSWEDCGDFEAEVSVGCIGFCSVSFPPGRDGAYHVCVGDPLGVATQGHVVTGWWSSASAEARIVPPQPTGKVCDLGSEDWDVLREVEDLVTYAEGLVPDRPGCADGVDNDNDGSTDWIDDAECNSPIDDTEQS